MKKKRIGIIGDLHLDDRNVGKHKNYYANCVDICNKITQLIKEQQLTHVILLGDIFGYTQHIVQKQASRVQFVDYFYTWQKLVKGNLYAVKGNHDAGAYTTDFDLLQTAGLIKTPKHIDVGGYRIHFMDYGATDRAIAVDEEKCNVAVVHSYLTIAGQTDYIKAKGGTELSSMQNLAGVSLVVCGHIHNPTQTYLQTSIAGKPVSLYYPGCPTRPSKEKDLWDSVNMLILTTEEVDGEVLLEESAVPIPLVDKDELFIDTLSDANIDCGDEAYTDVNVLGEILRNLEAYSLRVNGGYTEQVKRFGGVDSAATQMVIDYINKAEAQANNKENPTK